MQLFFSPDIDKNTTEFSFNRDESKHLYKVLRKKTGDIIYITNGKGWCFQSKIAHIDNHNCLIHVYSAKKQPQKDYYLHMAVAPTKMNDRFEWFLEKATEIGVDEITPIICDRSERKVVKLTRLSKIIQAAMKQSLNYHLPQLNEAVTLKAFLEKPLKENLCFIAHCENQEKFRLPKKVKKNDSILILIGPEGDFSPEEIAITLQKKIIPVTLSNNRLRTETAAMVACHSISLAADNLIPFLH